MPRIQLVQSISHVNCDWPVAMEIAFNRNKMKAIYLLNGFYILAQKGKEIRKEKRIRKKRKIPTSSSPPKLALALVKSHTKESLTFLVLLTMTSTCMAMR